MSEMNRPSGKNWSGAQAYSLAVVCLLAGVICGWLFRGSQSSATSASATGSSSTAAAPASQPTPEQMKQMADSAAAPLLDKLKTDPSNAALLASIGNTYYDVHEFPTAINYYEHSLKVDPANTGVRTDMATAYFYAGDTDTAINEFNKALAYEPNKPNTLYNLGMVKWQGKMDVDGAVAAWQKLLDTNPNYDGRQKVQQMIDEAKKHASIKPGTPAKPMS